MSNSSGVHFPDMSEDGSSLLQDLSLVSLGIAAQQYFLLSVPCFRILLPLGTSLETRRWASSTRTPSRTSLPSPTTTCPRRTCSQSTTSPWANICSRGGWRRASPPSPSVTRRRRRRKVGDSPGTRWSRPTRLRSQHSHRSVGALVFLRGSGCLTGATTNSSLSDWSGLLC